jgi:hypothetical protein
LRNSLQALTVFHAWIFQALIALEPEAGARAYPRQQAQKKPRNTPKQRPVSQYQMGYQQSEQQLAELDVMTALAREYPHSLQASEFFQTAMYGEVRDQIQLRDPWR